MLVVEEVHLGLVFAGAVLISCVVGGTLFALGFAWNGRGRGVKVEKSLGNWQNCVIDDTQNNQGRNSKWNCMKLLYRPELFGW